MPEPKKRQRNLRKKIYDDEDNVDGPQNEISGANGSERREDEATGTSLQDLLELRRLRRKQAGIELERLQRGDEKDREAAIKVDDDPFNGLAIGLNNIADPKKEEDKDKRIQKMTFTQQTNIVDVDKHMMNYIETEMSKRRGKSEEKEKLTPEKAGLDLFTMADGLLVSSKPTKVDNVAASAGMLQGIAEVDLGMESRLKNIEETEKAKQKLYQERRNNSNSSREDSGFAYTRFMVPQRHSNLPDARNQYQRARHQLSPPPKGVETSDKVADPEPLNERSSVENSQHQGRKRQFATDQRTMERFKSRMRR